MKRAFLRTVWLELQNLLRKQLPWLAWAGFCLVVLTARFSPWLRESYLPTIWAESLLLIVLEFLLPYFLMAALVVVLLPVFAGKEERGLRDTAIPCLLGKRGRDLAKILAAEGYALFLCLVFSGSAILLCGAVDGLGDLSAEVTVVGDVTLFPVWTVGEQGWFAILSLGAGCVLLTLVVLFISARSRDVITAAGTTAVLLLFEFLFHWFGFKPPLREINLWVFFRPYYFFLLELFPFSPVGNLLTLWGVLAAGGMTALMILRGWKED